MHLAAGPGPSLAVIRVSLSPALHSQGRAWGGNFMVPGGCSELATFQLIVAKRWQNRGNEAQDCFARFFFHFAALNALYFLWSRVDGKSQIEAQQVERLLSKASLDEVTTILSSVTSSIEYLTRKGPIKRMNRRTCDNGAAGGDDESGQQLQDSLRSADGKSPLLALGGILYRVRCNLVHGSKTDQGDDEEIIKQAVSPLSAILTWAIKHTESELERL